MLPTSTCVYGYPTVDSFEWLFFWPNGGHGGGVTHNDDASNKAAPWLDADEHTTASSMMNTMFMSNAKCILLVCFCLGGLNGPARALLPSIMTRAPRTPYHAYSSTTMMRVQSPENNQVDPEEPVQVEKSAKENDTPVQSVTRREPSPQEYYMAAMNTSPRRILLSFASASGIALAANFLGVTSKLLETVPESTVEATGLDTYFPRGA
jgi:hypothetical protein